MAGNINSFDILCDGLNASVIRTLAKNPNDDELCFLIAYYVAKIGGNVLNLPSKQASVRLARELNKQGVSSEKITKLTKLSKNTIYKILKDENE